MLIVFVGKKQPKQVVKCQKFKSEVMTTLKKKSAKCTNFEVSVLNF